MDIWVKLETQLELVVSSYVRILYVGQQCQHNSFTKRKRNLNPSPSQTLSVLPIDKRYKEEENLLDD